MNSYLQDYLAIHKKFPLGGSYSKEQRKVRHAMIMNWEKTTAHEFPTLDELIYFVKQYKNEILTPPQFFKKFKTVWQDDLNDGYRFAEFLLETDLQEVMRGLNISSMYAADQVLKHNSHHTKALTLKLKLLIRYHDFNLHELPWAVLTENRLEEELKFIEIMENIAYELSFKNENFKILVSNCKTYYPLWFEFLQKKENFPDGFEQFLISKGIDTEHIILPCVIV